VRPKADHDIDEIADNLTARANLDIGLSFLSEIYETFALIAAHPEIGWRSKVNHPQLKSARTFRVSERFSDHLIFYQPLQYHLEILRVLHGAQHLDSLFARSDSLD
jgi:plasmid stabilization system protein ParE